MPHPTNFLPQKVIKTLFGYEPESGRLFWLASPGAGIFAGLEAGSKDWGKDGIPKAIRVRFQGKTYSAPNLIFVYMKGRRPRPGMEIDHIDRNPFNNSWENLREATRGKNQANTRLYKNNSVGLRGVHLRKTSGRYRAIISRNGRNFAIGTYDTPELAHEAWKVAAVRQFGEFASIN